MTGLGKGLTIKKEITFGIQRRVVAHMTSSSWQTIPHVGGHYEPDVTEFLAEFKKFKDLRQKKKPNGPKITINTIMLKVISEGLKAAPLLNSIFKYSSSTKVGTIMVSEQINIAIPFVLDDDRDITPVIPNIGEKTVEELAKYIEDLGRRVKNTNIDEMLFNVSKQERLHDLKRLRLGVLPSLFAAIFGKHRVKHLKGQAKKDYYKIPESDRLTNEDIINGSCLVSNIGSSYRDYKGNLTLLEIIPPQTFVIGLSSLQRKPVVVIRNEEEKIEIRTIFPIVYAFDHRPFDFAHVIPFLKRLDEIFEKPANFFQSLG